ncbi:MAG: AsmA protein [Desulforhopalus sp.]
MEGSPMKKILKYGVVPAVVSLFLLCTTVMLLPVLINVQKYLPQIEKQVTRTTGRPFSVGSDFGLTFFPWLSVTFSDMRLGNPEGVIADDFLKIDSFEARVKLLPLLTNKVELSRFVVSGLNVNLQRQQNGRNNWDDLFTKDGVDTNQNILSKVGWLFSREFFVELFAITGGSVTWNDRQQDSNHTIDNVMVLLNNVSSIADSNADFRAKLDGHQVKGSGTVGPVSSNLPSLFMDLKLQVDDKIQALVKGECTYPINNSQCDLRVDIPSFSYKDLSGDAEIEKNENKPKFVAGKFIELGGHFIGNQTKFTVEAGSGTLDDIAFSYTLRHDSSIPMSNELEIGFKNVNLDPYFGRDANGPEGVVKNLSYPLVQSLKNSAVAGKIKSDELILAEVQVFNVSMDFSADNGVMNINNGGFDLHGGKGQFDAIIGLNNVPISLESRIELQQVQAEPFSKELIGVPFLTGPMKAQVTLKRADVPGSQLGKAFVGNGTIQIDGGSVLGLDLLSQESAADEKQTEFSKLSADIIMGAGVVRMKPLIFVGAQGITEMSAVVQLEDKSFSVSPDDNLAQDEALSLSGRYGPHGLAVLGFTDVHETKLVEMRDAQTLVDEKMPLPTDEDVTNMVGTPLIDPTIVAQRFGLKPELITKKKVKKAYNVGRGRVKINALQELDSTTFLE